MPIKVNNVFYTYSISKKDKVNALNDVSLSIEDGSFVAFLGETGSGKTTLAQHLNALLLPNEGEIEIDEFKVTNKKNKNLSKLRKKVGLVFQFSEYQLFEETVEKDVMFGPKNFGVDDTKAKQIAHEALSKLGIDESFYSRSPFELSGGEKRRVAIAGILANNPDIIVLDEPTVGLDPKSSKDLMDLISLLHKEGKTIILITHDMNIVVQYCEKVFYLNKGKLTYSGTPKGLFLESNLGLDIPELYELVIKCNEKGFNIPIENIHTLNDVMEFIKR